MMHAHLGYRRLRALVKKESLQIFRDPSSILIAFFMPVLLLLLFGYGVSLDAKDVKLAIVVEQSDATTASLAGAFRNSIYFNPVFHRSIHAAQRDLNVHAVDGILWLRNDFGSRLLNGETATVGVFVNGVEANRARIARGYIESVIAQWLERYSRERGRQIVPAVELESRVWFNAALRSRNFLVPGLIAVIMTLTGALLTSMVIAREWERGTMESLMATPARIFEIALGKLIPYFVLGMGGMLFSVIMAIGVFEVPLRGSFWVLATASALYMMVALGMGLLISTVARNQFVAGQVALVATFLPAFILSGFLFEIHSMPTVVALITHIVPARYFVSILQTVFMAGDIWPILIANGAVLLFLALFFLGLSWRKSRKQLD